MTDETTSPTAVDPGGEPREDEDVPSEALTLALALRRCCDDAFSDGEGAMRGYLDQAAQDLAVERLTAAPSPLTIPAGYVRVPAGALALMVDHLVASGRLGWAEQARGWLAGATDDTTVRRLREAAQTWRAMARGCEKAAPERGAEQAAGLRARAVALRGCADMAFSIAGEAAALAAAGVADPDAAGGGR